MLHWPEGEFLNKYEFWTWFQDLISNFQINSSWNWFLLEQGIPYSSRNRVGNRVGHLTDERSMPCSKINILWSMGNPIPNTILRNNSNVQICLKIPPQLCNCLTRSTLKDCRPRYLSVFLYIFLRLTYSSILHFYIFEAFNR